jgi:hypothetical protein
MFTNTRLRKTSNLSIMNSFFTPQLACEQASGTHTFRHLELYSSTRIINEAVAERDAETEKVIRKLGGAYLTLSTKLKLAEDHEKGYLKALNSKKKKRKRGQPFTEDLGVEEGVSMLFFSPSKVQKAREL